MAVDLGSHYAIAVRSAHKNLPAVISFDTKQMTHGKRVMRFFHDVHRAMRTTEHGIVSEIYFERVRAHDGQIAGMLYGAFYGALHLRAEQCDVPIYGVPVQHIKKFATGRGNASKKAMVAALVKAGFQSIVSPGGVDNDNIADALALLLLAERHGARYQMQKKK